MYPIRSFQLVFYDKFIRNVKNRAFFDHFYVYGEIERSNVSTADKMKWLDSEDVISKNFIRLNVAFGQRGLETLNSTAAMTWEDLASNIGGSLALYIGFTVMSFVELLELTCRLGRLAIVEQIRRVGIARAGLEGSL